MKRTANTSLAIMMAMAAILMFRAITVSADEVKEPMLSASAADLGANLEQLLKELDKDRSRQLTGTGNTASGTTAGTFTTTSMERVASGLRRTNETVLIVLGRRGAGNSPFKVERVLQVSPQADRTVSSGIIPAKNGFRSVYTMEAGTADRWNRLLAKNPIRLATSPETVIADVALNLLMSTKSAAFLFFSNPGTGAQSARINELYIVPDILRINITGAPLTKLLEAGTSVARATSEFVPAELRSASPDVPSVQNRDQTAFLTSRPGRVDPNGSRRKPAPDSPEGKAQAWEEETARTVSSRPPVTIPPVGPFNPPPPPRSR